MTSIKKRAAGIGAAVAILAAAGPVAGAGAATLPGVPGPAAVPAPTPVTAGPVTGAFQAGLDAAIGGWNAGADAAVGGWNAGAAALGLPQRFSVQDSGPLGVRTVGLAPLVPHGRVLTP